MRRAQAHRGNLAVNRRTRMVRFGVERLESRRLLATITVTDTGDGNIRDSVLTFREALLVANGALNVASLSAPEQALISGAVQSGTGSPPDVIAFNIPGVGLKTISPATPLPAVIDPVVIDGTTQSGTAANTLDSGSNATLFIATPVPLIQSGHCTIRGLVVTGGGIVLQGGDNLVEGCFVGTDASGTIAPGMSPGSPAQTGVTIQSDGNTVGGLTQASRNLISGNNQVGIRIDGGSSNLVVGNLIGTNALGTQGLANGIGVRLGMGSNNQVGGSTAAARNVISGNLGDGILVNSPGASTVISGNFIGVTADGVGRLGNRGSGVRVAVAGAGLVIGGTSINDGNVIYFNGADGVLVEAGTGVAILTNSIHGNQGIGIDLGADGPTANDPGDNDAGANNLQNSPQLATISSNGTTTTINGNLNSTPNTAFTIQFFSNSFASPVNKGQGQIFLGQATSVTTDGSGFVTFIATLAAGVAAGQPVTAVAIDPNGNTSEFSVDMPFTPDPPADLSVGIATSSDEVTVGQRVTVTITVTNAGPNGAANVSLVLGLSGAVQVHSVASSQGATSTSTGSVEAALATIAANHSATVTLVLDTTDAGTVTITGLTYSAATDPQSTNNTASRAFTVLGHPDLNLAVQAQSTVLINQNVTFEFTVSNPGPSTATGVTLTSDSFPAGTSLVSVSSSQGSSSVIGTSITTSLGTLAGGAQATVTIVLHATALGTIHFGATVTQVETDPDTDNDRALATVQVVSPADVSISVTGQPNPVFVNQSITYMILVHNSGGSAATNVTVHGTLTPGGTFISLQPSQGSATPGTGTIQASLGTIAPGEQATLTIVVTPTSPGAAMLQATVDSDTDANSLNNEASATVVVNALPPSVVVSDVRAWVTQGGIRGYFLTFSGPIDPVSASRPGAYFIIASGRSLRIKQVGYDVLTHTVTIDTRRGLPMNQFVMVGARGLGPMAVLAAPDTPIDGNSDGLPGGDMVVTVAYGRSFSYNDGSGDRVNLRLTGLGVLQLVRGFEGDARSLLIINTIPGRSVLTGSVRRGPRGQGDGVTPIPSVFGLNRVTNRLPRFRFLIG